MNDPHGWIGIGFAVILTAVLLLSLVDIFLYKNRQNQMKWVKGTMALQTVALGWGLGVFVSLGGFGTFLWDESIGIVFLTGALASLVYAHRRIKKDEELVQSMDRIR